jgi:glycosyltransferase involved in cell wall biosynthesis
VRTRLAIVATHPVQYHAPWFRALAARPELEVKVFFAQLPDPAAQGIGFGRELSWDLPLLDGYPWERLPNSRARPQLGGFLASSTPEVGEHLRAFAPGAALLTGWNQLPLLQALVACERLGVPRLVRGESNALKPRSPLVRLLHRQLLRRFDVFLAIGVANAAFYSANGVPPERQVPCPYFVDNERFARQAELLAASRGALRREWGIPEAAFCVAFAGKLVPKKRPSDLLAAAALARRDAPNLHVLVVGTGELEPALREQAAALDVPVTFAGFLNQTEIAEAYVAADVLALPSDHGETWGLVVNEAMACGRPAIVSDQVGCAPDLVHEGTTGLAFPCGDRDTLAARIGAMAGNPELSREMGRNAQGLVRAEYSIERACDAVVRAVELVRS